MLCGIYWRCCSWLGSLEDDDFGEGVMGVDASDV